MKSARKSSVAIVGLLESPVSPSIGLFNKLLKLWRKTTWPALGELVSAMAIVLESEKAASLRALSSEQRKGKDWEKRWKRDATSLKSVDRGALMDTLLFGSVDVVRDRLKLIEKWPADPRVATVLIDLVKSVPWTGTASRSTWRLAFRILAKTADRRVLELVASFDPGVFPVEADSARKFHLQELRKLGENVAAALAKSGEEEPTDKAHEEIASALHAIAGDEHRAGAAVSAGSIDEDFCDYGDRASLLARRQAARTERPEG